MSRMTSPSTLTSIFMALSYGRQLSIILRGVKVNLAAFTLNTSASWPPLQQNGAGKMHRKGSASVGCCGILQAQRRHHLCAECCIGQRSEPGGGVLLHVLRPAGARDGAGHGRMAEHVFEQDLRPAPAFDLARPVRQRLVTQPRQQAAAAER